MMALAIPAPHPDTGTATDPAASRNRALYRVPEAMLLLSLSRSMVYNQIRAGRLRSVKEGNARLIPADAIADYVALLKAEAEADR
ncbi:MAG TPA: helix-turn-helix domain-containing protein [Streptosporangiaceae bacterium]|nr:helix-turn-helix domain-containing protein [Streptosporangiaceae bacterium]